MDHFVKGSICVINFITGRCGSGKSTEVLRNMEKTLLETELDVLLVVPEQQTVVFETKIAEVIPEHLALRVEVTNFTRLANSVFREYGGLAVNRCDDGGRALILWRAMLSVWDGLTVYSKGTDGREDKNLPSLLSAVGEMKQNGISPLKLEEAAYALEGSDGESELTRRLYDLSLIFSAYEELLHEEYCDKHDVMNALCEMLETTGKDYFKNKACYIDSFFSLTMPQKRIVRTMMKNSAQLVVTFSLDPSENETAEDIRFREIRAYYDTMIRMAAEVTAEEAQTLNITKLTKDLRHPEGSPLYRIEKSLFSGETEQVSHEEETNAADSVRIIQCADLYEEAELCATLIEKLVREGARYSDIGVVARNMGSRSGIVDRALKQHGIPCFISERSALAGNPAIRLLTSLLDIQANGWLRRDVIRMIKTGLTPLKDYECDLLEEYTATWNIRGRRMFAEEDAWTMNPSGYRRELDSWGKETLAIVNSARQKLFPSILNFCRIFDGEGEEKNPPVRKICEGLVTFALDMGLYQSLMKQADGLRREGCLREAESARQIWQSVCLALDKLVLILGDTPLDAGRFQGLFTYVCTSMDIGTIPTAMDEVVLGSSDGVRFSEVEHMIILGSAEGEFPGLAEDLGFFCDADKLKLANVGVTLSDTTELQTAKEYFMYYRTACLAKKSLTVLVPASSGEMSQGALSLCALFGDHIVTSYGKLPLAERMYHPASADYAVGYETGEARKRLGEIAKSRNNRTAVGTMSIAAAEEKVSSATLGRLFGSRMSLSQSRIDSYVNCPFAYWCRYVMKLKEGAKAEISLPDIGVFVHEVMERFFAATGDRQYPLPQEETERIADEIIRDYIMALDSRTLNGRLRYLFIRLRRNVLCFLESIMEELSESEFKPIAFELPIGIQEDGKISLDAISFQMDDGSEIAIRGIADRVDLYKNKETGAAYVRVVDYKTGSKTFSLEDVQLGLNVQLLLYLFSIWKGRHTAVTGETEVLPAGAVYFSARPGDVTSDKMLSREEAKELVKSGISRSGLFLADDDVLSAMDHSEKFIPVKMKGGKAASAKNLVSLEEFGQLYHQLEKTIVRIGTEIKEGNAAASPLIRAGRSPCDYCSHAPICRQGDSQKKR